MWSRLGHAAWLIAGLLVFQWSSYTVQPHAIGTDAECLMCAAPTGRGILQDDARAAQIDVSRRDGALAQHKGHGGFGILADSEAVPLVFDRHDAVRGNSSTHAPAIHAFNARAPPSRG